MAKPSRRSMVLAAASAALPSLGAQQLPDFRGQMAATDVAALQKKENLSRDALMLKLLPKAQSHAHPPISHYSVGAVASGINGNLYFGQNIEIPGNPLGLAVHAEQSAIANAYMCGETGIDAIAIRGAPCGHCRQFLSEVSLEMSMRVLTPDRPRTRLADLLPYAFGPRNLDFSQGVFPPRTKTLRLLSASKDQLILAALEAASHAWAPYSRCLSGAALLTSTGRIFAGSYIENAAFNPSLPPLQCALAGYFAAAPESGQITRAILVEDENCVISQLTTSKSTLAAFAPSAKLQRHTFKR